MRYYGEIYDKEGRIVAVEIITARDSSATTIIGENGIWFAAEEAVTIEGQTNDLFDVLVRQSCTIRLEVQNFIPDFFQADFRDATVAVTLAGVPVFKGFITPRTFSQGYTEAVETLELNAVDRLSALQWVKWRNIGEPGVDYDFIKGGAGYHDVWTSICTAISAMNEMVPITENMATTLKIPMGAATDISWTQARISDALFYGDDEESAWSADEVLKHILQYFNLHAYDNGSYIEIFQWDQRKRGITVPITAQVAGGADTQISIPEIYNKFSVRCDAQTEDTVVPDFFSSDLCESPFSSMQLYCTEYSMSDSKEKGFPWGHLEDSDAFGQMVRGDDPAGIFSNLIWRRDYWIRAMKAKGWQLRRNCLLNEPTSTWDGTLPVPQVTPIYEEDTLATGKNQDRMASYITPRGGAAILSVTSGKREYKTGDRSDGGSTSKGDYIVIGTPGDGTGYDKELNNLPKMVYDGGEVNLSPLDDNTTHWLDFSGAITLAPVLFDALGKGGHTWDVRQNFGNMNRQQFQDYIKANLQMHYAEGEGKYRCYCRNWYTAENPSPLASGVTESQWLIGEKGDGTAGLDMLCLDETIKHYKHTGRILETNHVGTTEANAKIKRDFLPVPVLRCMLIVGDKCLVEYVDRSGGGAKRGFRWETYDATKVAGGDYSQSFCLSMDVKEGEYIVGQEHDIVKNTDVRQLLDTNGTAVPIRKNDNVKGKLTFLILGRTDLWGHSANGESFIGNYLYAGSSEEFFRYLNQLAAITPPSTPMTTYADRYKWLHDNTWFNTKPWVRPIFKDVTAIWLKDFKVSLISDNAYKDPLKEKDIIYLSDTSDNFINFKEEIDFKIFSALTDEERGNLGVLDIPGVKVPLKPDGSPLMSLTDSYTGKSGKPEKMFVDWFYSECSTPHIEVEQTIRAGIDSPARSTYSLPALPGRKFYPVNINRDLQAGTARLRMREIIR